MWEGLLRQATKANPKRRTKNRRRLLETTGSGMWGGYSDPVFMEQWVVIVPERFGR